MASVKASSQRRGNSSSPRGLAPSAGERAKRHSPPPALGRWGASAATSMKSIGPPVRLELQQARRLAARLRQFDTDQPVIASR